MPGRLFIDQPDQLTGAIEQLGITCEAMQEVRLNIAPGQSLGVITAAHKVEQMRWGIIPVGRVNARGRPVMETLINIRSETMLEKAAFAYMTRVVVPANGWYEWTGEGRKKTAWRIERKSETPLFFAALADLWHGPGGISLWQVATVTRLPNKDVAPYHHRMGVLLKESDVSIWLNGTDADAMDLYLSWPDGELSVSPARNVDWSAS